MAVVGRISRLAHLHHIRPERGFEAHGGNGRGVEGLAPVRRSGPAFRLTPTELSRALMVTSGGMTKRLAALGERGLIRREPDPADGRSRTVTLTPDGRRLVDEILPE